MRTKTLLLLSLFIVKFSYGQNAPVIMWEKSFGGSSDESATSIQQTHDGGYIIGGDAASIDGDVSGKKGYFDFWIVKLTAAGYISWQKCFGGSNGDFLRSIEETRDNGFVAAGITQSNDSDVTGNHGGNDCWIIKLDSTGTLEWQKCLGGNYDDYGQSIRQTSDGGFIVAGWSDSNDGDVTGHHGNPNYGDYWIVRLDSMGTIIWEKSLGGDEEDEAYFIMETNDKGFIVAGWSGSNDGDVTGHHGNQNYGDCWIVRLDSMGNIVWEKSLGGSKADFAYSITQTLDGGFAIAGTSYSSDGDVSNNFGNGDYWILKLSSTGTIEWENSFGGSKAEIAYAIQQTMDGGYIVAGSSASNDGFVSGNHGGSIGDYWILKLDANGQLIWQKALGGTKDDEAWSVIQALDGSYIIAGSSASDDGNVSVNHGDWDMWIVKLQGTTGIEEPVFSSSLDIFPDPASSFITLRLQSQMELNFNATTSITNLLGETIFQKSSRCIQGLLQETISLNEKIADGIYLVRVNSGQQQWSAPLIVAR